MVILVDMDGVLAHFDKEFLRRWRVRYPRLPYVPLKERTTFYIHEEPVYSPYSQEVRSITSQAGFFAGLPLIKGGKKGLYHLQQRGHIIHICTAPLSSNPTCLQEKYNWVVEKLGKEWAKRMVITDDKTLVRGDYLIDDRPRVTGSMEPVWKQVLFDTAYNRHIQDLQRVNSWKEVLALFP